VSTTQAALLDDAAIAAITAAASTIEERIRYGFRPLAAPGVADTAEQQLQAWRQLFQPAGRDAFDRRLALDGRTATTIRPYLGMVQPPESGSAPPWATTFRHCVEAVLAPLDTGSTPGAATWPALPFRDLLTPIVTVAAQRLTDRAGDRIGHLSPAARHDASVALLESLVEVSAPTLTVAFHAYRSTREATVFRIMRRLTDPARDELYRAFLADLRGGGLLELLRGYPVLGRWWGVLVDSWLETLDELLTRLHADQRLLGVPDQVSRLRMHMSDRHHGGRTVARLTFADGGMVVYKPRGMQIEATYNHLLAWLERRGAPVRLRPIRVLDRDRYGWAEHVTAAGCTDRAQVAAYHRRAGALLCLVYLLEGTDCHVENIVAAGADPVLVDAETLLHHRTASATAPGGDDLEPHGESDYGTSVHRTGMLPTWTVDRHGNPVDTSGLGGFGEPATLRRLLRWEYVDTDQLRLVEVPAHLPANQNVATLDGIAQSPLAFQDELTDGFTAMYRFWQRHRDELTGPSGPLRRFGGCTSRFIVRDSARYGQLRHGLTQPAAMADGVTMALALEPLAVAFVAAAEPDGHWPVVRSELAALQRYDIPHATGPVDGAALHLPDERPVQGYFAGPSLGQALDRCAALTEADLERQLTWIRAAFFTRGLDQPHQPEPQVGRPRRDRAQAVRRASADDDRSFVAMARLIATRLSEEAVRTDGGVAWIGLDYNPRLRRYRYHLVGDGWYSGRPGIAVFLAALWTVTGEQRWRDLALAATADLRDRLSNPDATAHGWPLHGAGAVYGLLRAGTLLGDPRLVDDAAALARRIQPEAIDTDQAFDVLAGSAGAVLSLLAVHRQTGDTTALGTAVACGQRLLAGRSLTRTGHRAWRGGGQPALTGFSHGAAGVAYALLTLWSATGRAEFAEAATEAIAFERAVFDPGTGNWPDFRGPPTASPRPAAPRFMTAWCHGATGIGLSRLTARDLVIAAETATTGKGGTDPAAAAVDAEINAAVTATAGYGPDGMDQLCCGGFGRIELLLTAGSRLDRPGLVDQARQEAYERINRARIDGLHLMHQLPRGLALPGFLQGSAGVGYQLLRLARPDELPLALLWE
jgi:type 2 lantibiotic biosynthesis protein LanM